MDRFWTVSWTGYFYSLVCAAAMCTVQVCPLVCAVHVILQFGLVLLLCVLCKYVQQLSVCSASISVVWFVLLLCVQCKYVQCMYFYGLVCAAAVCAVQVCAAV